VQEWIMVDAIRWLKVREAADRARCGPKTIYRAAQSGQLQAARLGGRRELRFLESWIDTWLIGQGVADDREIPVAIDAAATGARGFQLR
jgi:excisionase family DNA binding protein